MRRFGGLYLLSPKGLVRRSLPLGERDLALFGRGADAGDRGGGGAGPEVVGGLLGDAGCVSDAAS